MWNFQTVLVLLLEVKKSKEFTISQHLEVNQCSEKWFAPIITYL